jgi:hypothetical protein
MSQESIADSTKPNAGRIYDYILGGHHNFEVDRQAAERLAKMIPFLKEGARLQRWCLQDLATELTQKRGFDIIVDFASGLPTNDHFHHVVPPGCIVIYSDYDPVVVEYAQQILADIPNVYFFRADARRPEELLNRSEVKDILGDRRDVALVYWGVSSFLSDEEIAHAAKYLFEWSAPKSCWAFNAQNAGTKSDDPAVAEALKMYAQMGTPIYIRSLDTYRKLLDPWHPDEADFVSFLQWHGFDESILNEEIKNRSGQGAGNYGAYLVK